MNLAGFDLNMLVALDALLREESVSRAAERMRVGQPAMSATLRRLRTAFEDPLLVRSGRGLQRTSFAASLQEPLAAILSEVESLLNSDAAFDPATAERTFSIIASDYISVVLLRGFLERLRDTAPRVSVKVSPVDAGVLEQLRRGTVDLAIYLSELLPTNLPFSSEALFSDDFVCVTDRANDLVGDEFTLEHLSSLPYLAASQGVLGSLADQRLDEANISRDTTMVAQTFVVAPYLLPGTQMYTLIQRRLAAILMPESRFRTFRSPVPVALHEIMLWAPRKTNDAGHRWLRSELLRAARLMEPPTDINISDE